MPNPTTQSNLESARAILSNPAMFNRSVSAGLAGVSSSQASTESTQVEYTPLGLEIIPVPASTSCPADMSTMAVSSSHLVILKQEGPFVVPMPEAGDLDFADDDGDFETEKPFSSGDGQTLPTLPRQSTTDRTAIIAKVNKVLGCLNHSLEEIVASAKIKSQLLEATTFLNQHANSEASTLESFIEDLYNSNVFLESSSADFSAARDDMLKHKKDMAKYGAAFSKVKPLVETGVVKEGEVKSLEETQRLRVEELERASNTLLGIEQKRALSTSKHAAAVKAVEEADAKHKQAVEASSRLNKRQKELKLAFRSFLN
ncbi:hypothetical protein PIB30_061359 [Stylosanthes scabra]|uniref:Uncharacterized protein n=1 Tax=Stylosanthes scabra TaxID=79078 RepID=A0ABU6SL99_9FABA|nr:hypothetical protein [Stylosanthes scabra]